MAFKLTAYLTNGLTPFHPTPFHPGCLHAGAFPPRFPACPPTDSNRIRRST
jgi:hypothetical protein